MIQAPIYEQWLKDIRDKVSSPALLTTLMSEDENQMNNYRDQVIRTGLLIEAKVRDLYSGGNNVLPEVGVDGVNYLINAISSNISGIPWEIYTCDEDVIKLPVWVAMASKTYDFQNMEVLGEIIVKNPVDNSNVRMATEPIAGTHEPFSIPEYCKTILYGDKPEMFIDNIEFINPTILEYDPPEIEADQTIEDLLNIGIEWIRNQLH